MGNKVRARVELTGHYGNPSGPDAMAALKRMMAGFRRACDEAEIKRTLRQHEYHESKSRKKRRKLREAELARLKSKLRENFAPVRDKKKKPDHKRSA